MITRFLLMDIDGGHVEWMGLYEFDCAPEKALELIKEWRAAEKACEDDIDVWDLFPDLDQWVREHPTSNVKCVQLAFDPVDAITAEYLNEVSMP